jgi:Family of unknown function (DUF6580)
MNSEALRHGSSPHESLVIRMIVILAMIALAGVLRILPHPWNFTPVGAMALFAGAVIKDRRVAFLCPLIALLLGDLFTGFHRLVPFVYVSFLVEVALGYWVRNHRTVARLSFVTLLGAIQFFLITNFGIWALLGTYPHTAAGLITCYIIGLPLFLNTLAGDALYVTLFFGAFALAERLFPALREQAVTDTPTPARG